MIELVPGMVCEVKIHFYDIYGSPKAFFCRKAFPESPEIGLSQVLPLLQ